MFHLPVVYKPMTNQLQPSEDDLGIKHRIRPLTVGKHQVFGSNYGVLAEELGLQPGDWGCNSWILMIFAIKLIFSDLLFSFIYKLVWGHRRLKYVKMMVLNPNGSLSFRPVPKCIRGTRGDLPLLRRSGASAGVSAPCAAALGAFGRRPRRQRQRRGWAAHVLGSGTHGESPSYHGGTIPSRGL